MRPLLPVAACTARGTNNVKRESARMQISRAVTDGRPSRTFDLVSILILLSFIIITTIAMLFSHLTQLFFYHQVYFSIPSILRNFLMFMFELPIRRVVMASLHGENGASYVPFT